MSESIEVALAELLCELNEGKPKRIKLRRIKSGGGQEGYSDMVEIFNLLAELEVYN